MAGKKQLHLTEGQKNCLRMVDDLLTSKEIARKLGISPFTVDQRLDSARKKLQAQSRKDAARIYLAMETRSLSEPIVYDPRDIADFDFKAMLSPTVGEEATQSDGPGSEEKHDQMIVPTAPVLQLTSYAEMLKTLLETGVICVIMVSAMTLILAGLMRALD
jgi:DNA-binding CsgD family transcriptional regulator